MGSEFALWRLVASISGNVCVVLVEGLCTDGWEHIIYRPSSGAGVSCELPNLVPHCTRVCYSIHPREFSTVKCLYELATAWSWSLPGISQCHLGVQTEPCHTNSIYKSRSYSYSQVKKRIKLAGSSFGGNADLFTSTQPDRSMCLGSSTIYFLVAFSYYQQEHNNK